MLASVRILPADQPPLSYPAPMRLSRTIPALAALALSSAAFAQIEPPPDPNFTPQTSPVIGYLIVAVLFGVIVAVSLMPSKRSHTDL